MSIPQVKVPEFSMTLPVSKQTITFRPFVVKEEKLLLLAKESQTTEDTVRAIMDVVESCTFGTMKGDDYCLADLQYAFLQIRGKSIGEEIELILICGECNSKQPYVVTVNDFEIQGDLQTSKVLNLGDVKVEMKYPDILHYGKLIEDGSNEAIFNVIVECIQKIFSEEEMFVNSEEHHHEVREFVDNLTAENFEKFEQFFLSMPLLLKKIKFTCKQCEIVNNLQVDTIRNFFH
jgi:hypothetical protein